MAVFGLLHGGFEGAWCWDLLRPELHELGHETVAVDLPIGDVNATWEDHVDAALASFTDPDLVVVAHSRSGRLVPRLLERGKFTRVILLSSAIPGGLLPPPYRTGGIPAAGAVPAGAPPRQVDDLGRTVPTEAAAARLFSDCSPEVVAWAMSHVQPQHELPVPADTLWPAADVAYIYGVDEKTVDPEWIVEACRERLGIEPLALPGGHSLFMSRPRELAAMMDSVVAGWLR